MNKCKENFIFFLKMHMWFNVFQGKPDPVTVFKRNTGKAIFTKDFPYYSVLIESKESEDYDDHFEEFEFAAKHFGDKVSFYSTKKTSIRLQWDSMVIHTKWDSIF